MQRGKAAQSDKWGDALTPGFQILPDLVLKAQGTLGLSCVEVIVLENVLMNWWVRDALSFPTARTISRRMGTSERTVRRSLKRLVNKRILKKVCRGELDSGDPTRKKLPPGTRFLYDPSPLVRRLCAMAPHDDAYKKRAKENSDQLQRNIDTTAP